MSTIKRIRQDIAELQGHLGAIMEYHADQVIRDGGDPQEDAKFVQLNQASLRLSQAHRWLEKAGGEISEEEPVPKLPEGYYQEGSNIYNDKIGLEFRSVESPEEARRRFMEVWDFERKEFHQVLARQKEE